MESLTLSDNKVSTMLTKFGIMCQILPFYGHVNLWKYTLEKLSPQTKAFWNEYIYPILKNKTNSNVLNLTKYMKFQIIENTKPINEEFINYIKSPDI